jgi:RHS repeat-associated protein
MRACIARLVATFVAAVALPSSALVYTKSSGGVDSNGGTNYTVPLVVPPGTAGVVPSLSLSYNSALPNGLLGVGWGISGFSAITRCPRTMAADNVNGSVNLDANDRFCLDGNRLLVNGSATYGADQAVYFTEIETFNKVMSNGSAGTGPAWFKVWTRDGLIMEYGNTTDSRVEAVGSATARAWMLNKVSDRKGNYYTIQYDENTTTGESYPIRIDYTGNPNVPLATYNKVEFTYELRPDVETSWVALSPSPQAHRLSVIKTFTSGALVKEYRLAYGLAGLSGKSRLASVTECAPGNVCFSPLTFSYSEGGGGINQGIVTPSELPNPAPTRLILSTLKGDFNGDGVQDVLLADNAGDSRICFGPGFTQCTATWHHNGLPLWTLDINGDGVTDILVKYPNGTLNYCLGPTFPPSSSCYAVAGNYADFDFVIGDFNADGRDDLYMWNTIPGPPLYQIGGFACDATSLMGGVDCSNGYGFLSFGPSGRDYKVTKGDFDGDGRADLLFMGTNHYKVCRGVNISSTAGCSSPATAPSVSMGVNWRDDATIVAGDFTGDGLEEILVLSTVGLHSCVSPGFMTANNCTAVVSAGDWKASYQPLTGDFDLDGRRDLFLAGPSAGYVCKGPGITTTNNCAQVTAVDWRNAQLLQADFTGDASADVFAVVTGNALRMVAGGTSRPDLLVQGTNTALGTSHTFTYKPLTDSSVYTKGVGAVYPLRDTRLPFYVASQFTAPNGVGGNNEHNYKYRKGMLSFDGRGSLGFEEVEETDVVRGRVTTTLRSQAFPHFGRVTQTTTKVNNVVMREQIRTLDTVTGFARPFSVVVSEVLSENGLDSRYSSEYVTYAYDSYGNILTKSYCWDRNSCNPPFNTLKRVENYTYTNDSSQWLLGVPASTTIVYKDAQGNPTYQAADYWPLPGTRLVQTEVRNARPGPESSLQTAVTIVYTYDAFGNVIGTTTTPYGMDVRTTATGYDTQGRFPISSTNELSQVTTFEFDARFGGKTRETSPNALVTTWTRDDFGRSTRELRADGTSTDYSYEIYTTTGWAENPNLSYRIVATSTGSVQPTIKYFDALDRELTTLRYNFANTDWIVSGNTWYDAKGKVIRSYLPFEGGSPTKPYITSVYDAYGRLSTKTEANGAVTTTTYSSQGIYNITTVRNARNFDTKYARNAHGNLMYVTDANNKTTFYEYNGLGKMTKITDPLGNVTTMSYNNMGSMLSKSDPDLGTWTYTYNPLQQQVSQTDAKSQVTTFVYDKLGRLTQRNEPSMSATWTWDTATKGIGKIASTSTNGNVTRSYSYDAYGRPYAQTLSVDSISYTLSTTYDAAGRPEVLTYPTGFAVKNVYNPVGYLAEVRNSATNALFWKSVAMSPAGITDEDYGNGTGVARVFDNNTQRLLQIGTTRDSDNSVIQNYTYGYDFVGNMTSRSETTQSVAESYSYDALDRLVSTTGPASKTYQYDDLGNIASKSDVPGYYYYPATGKVHATISAGGTAYTYDANGNMATGGAKTFTWTSFNMPASITMGAASYSWAYDGDRNRVKFTTPSETTTYFGEGSLLPYEKSVAGGLTEHRHRIFAGGRLVAQYAQRSDGTSTTAFAYRDHLDSTALISDSSSAVVERLSYDAHGKRRFSNGADDPSNTLRGATSDFGFTGHEHLDDLGLIHMNGRLYEPKLGRFLSADPVYADAIIPQSLNRYSYVLNNPFKFVDPTGYRPKKVKKTLRIDRSGDGVRSIVRRGLGRRTVTDVEKSGSFMCAAAFCRSVILNPDEDWDWQEDATCRRGDCQFPFEIEDDDKGDDQDNCQREKGSRQQKAGTHCPGDDNDTPPNPSNNPPQPPPMTTRFCFADSGAVATYAGAIGAGYGAAVGAWHFGHAMRLARRTQSLVDLWAVGHAGMDIINTSAMGATAFITIAVGANEILRILVPCE